MAPNCTLKANLKRPISQATKSEVRPYINVNLGFIPRRKLL